MKILLINEYKSYGGAEQIVKNQIEIFKSKGHTVKTLVFSYDSSLNNRDDNYYLISNSFPINNKIFNLSYYLKIRKYIKNFAPDIIFVHNMFSSPITQYRTLKGFRAYQTVHDYSAVCPTIWCIDDNGNVCGGYCSENCLKKCKYRGSKLILFYKLCFAKKIEKLRKKYIAKLISPSEKLCEYLRKFGYNSVCLNNPISDIPAALSVKSISNTKRYIYAGAISERKGIFEFLNVFSEYSKNKDAALKIYGNASAEALDKLNSFAEKSNGKIQYGGKLSNTEIRNEILNSDYMVVPSKWMENYPTVVLEAMLLGTVVIGSDRGGIPEMLENNCGYVYKFGDTQSLISILDFTYNLDVEKYNLIRENAFNKVKKCNNYEVYYNEIINLK